MQPNGKKIWFPAKRYGWGWGPPICWQGWAVVIGWTLLNGAAAFLFWRIPALFAVCFIVSTLALMVVFFLKGEPPRWRWGDD